MPPSRASSSTRFVNILGLLATHLVDLHCLRTVNINDERSVAGWTRTAAGLSCWRDSRVIRADWQDLLHDVQVPL